MDAVVAQLERDLASPAAALAGTHPISNFCRLLCAIDKAEA